MQASPNNPTAFADAAEMWNRRFSDDGYLFGTEPNVWLREHSSQWKTGHRVLCVADGGKLQCLRFTALSADSNQMHPGYIAGFFLARSSSWKLGAQTRRLICTKEPS